MPGSNRHLLRAHRKVEAPPPMPGDHRNDLEKIIDDYKIQEKKKRTITFLGDYLKRYQDQDMISSK